MDNDVSHRATDVKLILLRPLKQFNILHRNERG
jgi:hypothetical protein